ncbi:unnamed protein product [Brachionus calyciflorus]|uniref:G-protein coupled receptors family 1 profile domain-containing protein n=1 Tax=Brachionus calyciflorus TaxID=104777 RepID=A0A814HB50_9BILA|nr:unnamed protein product [Brachionus calyciflorus]
MYSINISTVPSNESDYNPLNIYIETFYEYSKWINAIFMTIIAIVGLYGNLMSMLIFSSKSYNKNSIKSLRLYLIILSMSDLFVIIFHYVDFTFRQWVNLTGSYSTKFNFVDKISMLCKLVPYFRNVFRTVSVYTLLLMTLQRLILLHFSSLRIKWSSTKFNKKLLISLFVTSLLINASNLYINDLVKHPYTGEFYCSVQSEYTNLQFKIDVVFVFITILIPSIFILLLSVILFINVKKGLNKTRRVAKRSIQGNMNLLNKQVLKYKDYFNYLNTRYPQLPNLENIQTIEIKELNRIDRGLATDDIQVQNFSYDKELAKFKQEKDASAIKKSLSQSIRTTYMLVIVSKWFILLHLPYFLSWMLFHLSANKTFFATLDSINQKYLLRAFLNLFEIFFLLNYTINFILYFVNGPLFRKRHAKKIFKIIQNLVYIVSQCFKYIF